MPALHYQFSDMVVASSDALPELPSTTVDPAEVVVEWHPIHALERRPVFSSWNKAERKRHFADLLESFDPMYPSLYLARLAQGQQVDALAPEALDAWANQEWVDPRW